MAKVVTDFPFRVEVTEGHKIALPDGTRLAARLWRPEGAGRVPAILEYLPYRLRDGTRTRDNQMHEYLAGHGYACIRVDIRGTGDSEGLISDEYSEAELADGCDVIKWIAAQDWCDGQVAMIGISWGGFNGLQIAARQPPALKTVITVGSTDDRYATDIHWVGGCLSKDNFDWSATMLSSNDLPPDPAIAGEGWRAMWEARIAANRPWILDWMRHQRRDAFWKHGSVCEDFDAIRVPVYAVSGWADNYSESIPRLLAGLKVPCRGLIGPWAHSYPYQVAVEPAIGWLQEVIRWCDHWMKGRETGIMTEPALRAWMQESVPPQTCYTERPGRWVGEDKWPSPRIPGERMPLGADGRLGSGAPGERSVCSPLWVGLAAGEVGRYGQDAEWPTDQREDDGGSLVFVSEPLAEGVEILGAPRVELTFRSDRPQALVCARLNDVAPDGSSTRVTVGLLNLTHRNSHEFPEALVPGELARATVEMDDIAHAFPKGHRIAVSFSTTYWPIAWPSPELATLTISCGESALILPVRPPRPEDAALRPFDPPEMAAPSSVTYHETAQGTPRRVTRDLLSGRMTVDFPRWTYAKDMTDIGQSHSSSGSVVFHITDGDPLSAETRTDYQSDITRGGVRYWHHSTGRMTCDATHFIIEIDVAAGEDDREIARKVWRDRIPRDHM